MFSWLNSFFRNSYFVKIVYVKLETGFASRLIFELILYVVSNLYYVMPTVNVRSPTGSESSFSKSVAHAPTRPMSTPISLPDGSILTELAVLTLSFKLFPVTIELAASSLTLKFNEDIRRKQLRES